MDRRLITLGFIAAFSTGAGFARLPVAETTSEAAPEPAPVAVPPIAPDVLDGIEPWTALGPGPTCELLLNHYAEGTSLTTLVNTIQYAWSFETFAVAECLERNEAPTLLVGAAIPLIHLDPSQGGCAYSDALASELERWSDCEPLLPALIERARADRVVLKARTLEPPVMEPPVMELPVRRDRWPENGSMSVPAFYEPDIHDLVLETGSVTL